jgi:tagaturonate epimerase
LLSPKSSEIMGDRIGDADLLCNVSRWLNSHDCSIFGCSGPTPGMYNARMELERYSFGVGDRFGFEGVAQLRALQKAAAAGTRIVPVWNKSNREHAIVGSAPESTRKEADEAVRDTGWTDSYYVDADHITLENVDPYIPSSDFFTIDIADYIGKQVSGAPKASLLSNIARYKGKHAIPGLSAPVEITDRVIESFSENYLLGIIEAGKVYRHITQQKSANRFVVEVSIDEARTPQTAVEMLLILAGLATEGLPLQTIAPKFVGSFLKGVDYVGDPQAFMQGFNEYLAVIAYAVQAFNLPPNLKLSIHTGSDKFTLYPLVHRAITNMDTGIHLKTAGTTWLEELAGIAASGGAGLEFARDIYQEAYGRCEQLCRPYLAIINIDPHQLPFPTVVASWSPEEFVSALRHDPLCRNYNPHLRQLLHIGFKVAAETKTRFEAMLRQYRSAIEDNVTINLFERHIRPLFGV